MKNRVIGDLVTGDLTALHSSSYTMSGSQVPPHTGARVVLASPTAREQLQKWFRNRSPPWAILFRTSGAGAWPDEPSRRSKRRHRSPDSNDEV
jgi:hypothetical protein